MTQRHFVERREPFWNTFEGIINGGAGSVKKHAPWFPRAFRELTQDLNIARAHGFDPSIIERLNHLVLEGSQILYGHHGVSLRGPADFLFRTFPRTVRAQWRGLGAVHLIFYGLSLFIALACVRFPDLVYDLISGEEAAYIERMYDPSGEYFLKPRFISADADMFGFYIYNNISIAFKIFGAGILAGFGSLLTLCFNAVFMGAAAAHVINLGFSEPFFSFAAGHSSLELTGILLSAQGGLLLGYRLFVTRGLSREASLRAAGKTAVPLIAGSALLLFLAAVVEAFWSSRHEIDPVIHYAAGIAGWVCLALYFIFAGRKKP
ncbi:MAG: stage II sporulation protein M [Spirochaetaceae bacterium]|jgi:uncharacterized membrane protein SpoIIM required for sporulation|nr:stage II sporulation protein M [Spirochaetaceae bacterium]